MRYHKLQPTDAQRAEVKRLVLEGISQVKIAAKLRIAKSTLQRYFAGELKFYDRPEGRPRWEPTEEDREAVTILVCAGFKQDSIARRFGISVDTLQLYCEIEIANGYDLRRQDVVLALYRKAVGSDKNPNSAAINQFLKNVDTLPQPQSHRPRVMTPGKKEQAVADASTASQGTSWDQLLNARSPGSPN